MSQTEGLALLLTGIALPVVAFLDVFTAVNAPSAAVSVAFVLWVAWYLKWASEGGMPVMRS